ncbi:MAG: hypothetical protein RL692_343 [Planctomycetota bacterium]
MKRTYLLFICSLSALLLNSACEDPSVAMQDNAAKQIREGGEKMAQVAHQASIDRVSAAEEMRNAGSRLANVPGASETQKKVAASLSANASTQAALLEIGKADQIESTNISSRMLANGLLQVVDDIHVILAAQDTEGIANETKAIEPNLAKALNEQREHESQQSVLNSKLADLRSVNEVALADAQTLLAEAEEIRIRGLRAQRGEISVLAEEAGRKRDEARASQTTAEDAEVNETAQNSVLRLRTGEALSAQRRAQAFQGALDVLSKLASNQNATDAQENTISDALKVSILKLVAASNPDEDLELKGCYERTFSDLENADAAARRSGPNNSSLFSIASARARALLMRGQGEFQQALLFRSLAMSPSMGQSEDGFKGKADAWLAKAQASTKEAIDAYTALQEVLANSGSESPSKQALVLTVERALKVAMPTFNMAVVSQAESVNKDETVAPSETPAETDSKEAPATTSGNASMVFPFATVEDLAAFFGSTNRDPAATARIDELLVATTQEGQALATTAFGAVQAIGKLQVAMQEKFGSSNLGPLSAMIGKGSQATVSDATEKTATIEIKSAQGALSFQAALTDNGWKLDLDSTATQMDESMKAQMSAAGAMMGTLTQGLTQVTERIENGQLKSAQAVQGALMMAMQKLMGGMGGPGGGGAQDDNTPTEN